MIAKSGDLVRLGVEIGHALDPTMLFGRLVAIQHHVEREIHKYVLREYRDGDRLGIPTGGYRTIARPFLVPYEPRCGCPVNEFGDICCHVCGERVNVKCWQCQTPRGEGLCPNPVASS